MRHSRSVIQFVVLERGGSKKNLSVLYFYLQLLPRSGSLVVIVTDIFLCDRVKIEPSPKRQSHRTFILLFEELKRRQKK